jgi:uncharacterized membrane protein YhaH (DUF805 family)
MATFNPFVYSGRIGRLQYFGFGAVWSVLVVVATLILVSGTGMGVDSTADLVLSLSLLWLAYAALTFSYGVRRLHDVDASGWWYLLGFVPVVNSALAAILLVAPGTDGENRYGVR